SMSTTDGVNYSASNVSFPAGGGLVKFRQDSSWNVNWGSNQFPSGVATQGGLDIPVPAGSYDITFNIQTGAYNFTFIPSGFPVIGMIGEFNNWAESVDMFTTDGVVYVLNNFFIPTPVSAPGLKFRQDNSWDVNWGGTAFPSGTAVLGGGNI
ncbi:hypothetical protein RZS08_14425, partial [Arthrospira platensis SPKY1]|nr:hypothetical protein [Arthrospira platensis SPKY1]